MAFPLFADQFFNAKKVEHFRLGVSVDHSNFDVEQLVEKIENVINEPRYGKPDKLQVLGPLSLVARNCLLFLKVTEGQQPWEAIFRTATSRFNDNS